MHVFVTGATGFLGSYLAPALLEAGHTVRCLVRPGSEKRLPPGAARMEVVHGDVQRPESYRAAMRGCDALIHLVSISSVISDGPCDEETFERRLLERLKLVIDTARDAGIRRYLFTSTYAARFAHLRGYARANRLVEDYLTRDDVPSWTIFRLNFVYGDPRHQELEDGLLLQIRLHLEGRRLVFLAGGGNEVIQPVHVEDVTAGVVRALATERTHNSVFDVAGATRLPWRRLLEWLLQASGLPRPTFVSIPASWANSVVAIFGKAALSNASIPIYDRTCDAASFFADLGLSPPRTISPEDLRYLRRWY